MFLTLELQLLVSRNKNNNHFDDQSIASTYNNRNKCVKKQQCVKVLCCRFQIIQPWFPSCSSKTLKRFRALKFEDFEE